MNYTETDVRSGGINGNSAWGGFYDSANYNKNGRGRTIIDATASYFLNNRPRETGDNVLGGFGDGTSIAAPIVGSSALSFVDFYRQFASNYIDEPGALFVSLLLMADRQDASGSKLSGGFSRVFGAGRQKMRRLDATGLDDPWYWFNGNLCVRNGEVVTFALNAGSPFPADADDLKAVAWWYDPEFHSGAAMDSINLKLMEGTTALSTSLSAYDNKEMVYFTGVGGRSVQLSFHGFDVTTDNQCAEGIENGVIVYFFVYAEDADREGAEGLSNVERM